MIVMDTTADISKAEKCLYKITMTCPICGKEKCSLQQIGQECPRLSHPTNPIISCASATVPLCHGHPDTHQPITAPAENGEAPATQVGTIAGMHPTTFAVKYGERSTAPAMGDWEAEKIKTLFHEMHRCWINTCSVCWKFSLTLDTIIAQKQKEAAEQLDKYKKTMLAINNELKVHEHVCTVEHCHVNLVAMNINAARSAEERFKG